MQVAYGDTLISQGRYFYPICSEQPPLVLGLYRDEVKPKSSMGRDVCFMDNSLPMISKHASVEEACVGCHT